MHQNADPTKCKVLLYDEADFAGIEKLLSDKFDWWKEEVKQRRSESRKAFVERIVLSFEAFLLREVVNVYVPCTYTKQKEEPSGGASSLLEKQKYLQGVLAEGINDVSWNKVLRFIGNEIKGNAVIRQLNTERGVLRKHEDVAEYLNEKFTLQTHDSTKLQVPYVNRLHEVMEFQLDEEVLAEKLENLPSNKSSQNSEISYEMLRLAPASLAPYLCLLYRTCLKARHLPAQWLHSLVIPKHKGHGASPLLPESYRPISLSPAVGKVLEHFVSDYLCSMLDQKSTLHPRQHGHRKGYSNESQLACFVEDLSQFTRGGAQVDCIKIDLKSATSYVNHEILLARLQNLFIDRGIFKYLKRFIEEHTQSVKVGCCTSSQRPMRQGLPQGSPLTNPLFLIYIDPIFDVMKNRSQLRCFGDDIVAYKMVFTADHQFCLQEDVYHIQTFFENNGLQVNLKKLQMVTFCNKEKFKEEKYLHRNYLMYDRQVVRSSSLEYLGVTVSENLTFHEHVQGMLTRFEPQFKTNMDLMQLCSPEAKKLLYVHMLRPKLETCSAVWNLKNDFSEDVLIASLERLQQKYVAYALDVEFHSESWHPSWDKNLEELNWEPLLARRLMQRLNLTKKFMQRVPCLRELVRIQQQLQETKQYDNMKLDRTSLLGSCKKEWHRMRSYFKKNPHKILNIEDCSLYCQEEYCVSVAKEYSERRALCVGKLKNSDPETVRTLGKKFPFSVCPLVNMD